MPLTVGLDWGATGHALCVVDDHGTVITHFECPHSAAGLAELVGKLRRLAAPARGH